MSSMILWKLNEVMAKKRIKGAVLAQKIGVTPTSMSRLRSQDTMPRLTPERLDQLCLHLDCQPGDLLVFAKEEKAE